MGANEMIRYTLIMLAFSVLLGCAVANTVKTVLTRSSNEFDVSGELQRHHPTQFQGETFWVNGWRLTIEDRPEAKAWLEDQVGKHVDIVVRAK